MRACSLGAPIEDFDVVGKPAAEKLAPFGSRAPARRETRPVGDIHRPVHVVPVAPAVVGHADGVAVRHRLGIDEILAAKRDAIDAQSLRRDVDEPLDGERHLRPSGAAIGVGRHGVGIDRHRAQRGAGNGVGAHDQAGSLGERRERHAARAHIADIGRAHGEEAAVPGERQFDLGDEVASLKVAEERFGAGGGELDRTAELARGPQHQAELDEHAVARAEIAADVVGEHAQPLRRDAEHGGKLALLPHRAAAAGMERVAPARPIVVTERGARLKRHAGHAIDVEVHGHDVLGARERLVRRLPIAEPGVDRNVARHLVPNHGRARPHRVFGMVDPRQHVVVDGDGLRGVERLRHRLGHHHRHRLADMAHLVGGQEEVRADEERPAARRLQLHVVFGLGQRIVRDGGKPVGEAVDAGEDAEDARHRLGAPAVDAEDARVRVGGAQHHRVGLAVDAEIVAEAAAAGGEPLVLLADDGLTDGAEACFRGSRFLIEVGHHDRLSAFLDHLRIAPHADITGLSSPLVPAKAGTQVLLDSRFRGNERSFNTTFVTSRKSCRYTGAFTATAWRS